MPKQNGKNTRTRKGKGPRLVEPARRNVLKENGKKTDLVNDTVPQMHQIIPRLFLGNERSAGVFRERSSESVDTKLACARARLSDAGITHILNCSDDEQIFPDLCRYMNIASKQRTTQETGVSFLDALPQCIKFIGDALRVTHNAVLVYCNNGKKESASVVTAYVMQAFDETASASYRRISAIRSLVEFSPADQILLFRRLSQHYSNEEKRLVKESAATAVIASGAAADTETEKGTGKESSSEGHVQKPE